MWDVKSEIVNQSNASPKSNHTPSKSKITDVFVVFYVHSKSFYLNAAQCTAIHENSIYFCAIDHYYY